MFHIGVEAKEHVVVEAMVDVVAVAEVAVAIGVVEVVGAVAIVVAVVVDVLGAGLELALVHLGIVLAPALEQRRGRRMSKR